MSIQEIIYNWLKTVRSENHKEISITNYSKEEVTNWFDSSTYKPTPEDWIHVFQEIPEISCVTYLEANCKEANWNNEILTLCSRVFPNLQKLHLLVKAQKDFSIVLDFPNLKELTLNVLQKPSNADISFAGNLPSLELLILHHAGKVRIDSQSLAILLVNSQLLKHLHLYCKDSWLIAEVISEMLFRENRKEKPILSICRSLSETSLWSYTIRTDEEKAQEWTIIQKCWKLYANIDFATALTVCTDKEKFLLATQFMNSDVEHLELLGDIHSFLLLEPELLQCFSSVKSLKIIHARELTTDNFQKICEVLPHLTRCTFYNNHNPNFRTLRIKSNTLQELHLTHFHCLESFEIHSESLEILELDNCSDSTLVNYPEINGRWCNGLFGEKFLSALLNGDKSLFVPNLKYLHIWHNQNGFGPPLLYENLRMEIDCSVGHPKLEELHLSRLSHIRRLTLRNLPNLQSLSINDDFAEGEGSMEFLDTSALPPNCKILLDGNLGTTKTSEYNW